MKTLERLPRRQVSGLAASVYPATRSPPCPSWSPESAFRPSTQCTTVPKGHHHAPLSWWAERSSQPPHGLSKLAQEFLQCELFTATSPLMGELLPAGGIPLFQAAQTIWTRRACGPFPQTRLKGILLLPSKPQAVQPQLTLRPLLGIKAPRLFLHPGPFLALHKLAYVTAKRQK